MNILEDAGKAAGVALLDIIDENPISRIGTTSYRTLDGVRSEITSLVCNKIKVR